MKNLPRKSHLNRKLVALAVASCFAAGGAYANPTAPAVVNGAASILRSGNLLQITNSPNAIINWGSFSIGANEITRFIQQSQASSVLNRVIGQDPSSILGALQSNGRVFLINPNGILFGAGAQIDVAGLVASTLNLSNADFLAGRLKFSEIPGAGSLVNQGNITTPQGGNVYLVAPDMTNSGIITSPKGEVVLAAGKSVELVNPGTPNLRVEITASDNAARNLGQIVADSGRIGIYAGLINQSGRIRADSVTVGENGQILLKATKNTTLEAGSLTTANGPSGGKIEIQSGDTTLVSGTVEAKGISSPVMGEGEGGGEVGKGGTVHILGNLVGLTDNARIDASGESGGGTVLVGGDYQGKNPDVQNAFRTYFGPDASIRADAITAGNGGKVIVWSDDATRAYGAISAKGGAQSGNGGFVETSGHFLDVTRAPDLSAPQGLGGTWLVDPINIEVVAGTTLVNNTGSPLFTPSVTNSQIGANLIVTQLNSNTNVTLDTNVAGPDAGNITVSSPIAATPTGAPILSLNANNLITINQPVTTTRGSISLTATGAVNVNNSVQVTSGTGPVQITGGTVTLSNSGTIVEARGGIGTDSVQLTATNGGITVGNGVTINAASFGNASVTLSATGGGISLNGATLSASGGNVGSGTGGAASISLSSTGGVSSNSLNSTSLSATGGNSADTLGGGGGAADILVQSAGAIDLTGSSLVATGGTALTGTAGTATATVKVANTLGNNSPSGDIIAHNITAGNVELQQNSVAEKGIKRASATSLITANQLLMELDRPDNLNFGGSIGTSAEPMRVQVSKLEAHTHEAISPGGGIFIESPNAGNLQIGGLTPAFFSGAVRGVQNVTSGDISVSVNGALTTLPAGASPGGPVATASGNITLRADDMSIGDTVNAATGSVTLTPFSTTRDIFIIVPTTPPPGLSLDTTELSRVTAGTTLEIGRSTDTGTLTVSAALSSGGVNASTLKLAHQNISLNSAIDFSAGGESLTLTPGSSGAANFASITVSAPLTVNGSANLANTTFAENTFVSGFLTLPANNTLTINTGKTLSANGGMTLATAAFQNSAVTGGGTLAIAAGTTATFTSGDNRQLFFNNVTLNNAGTFNMQGVSSGSSIELNNGAVFNNLAGGQLRFVNNNNAINTGAGIGTINNSGTISSVSANPVNIATTALNLNTGSTVDADTGTAFLGASTDSYSGTLALTGDVRMSAGTHTFNDGAVINGTGNLTQAGGAAVMNDVTMNKAYVLNPNNTLTINTGKTLSANGGMTLATAAFQNSAVTGGGTLAIAAGTTATFSSADNRQLFFNNVTVNNAGTFNMQGVSSGSSIELNNGAVFNNLAGAQLRFVNNNNAINTGAGVGALNNTGTISLVGGVGSTINPTTFTNSGTLSIDAGATLSTGGNALTNAGGGVISGTGTLDLGGATLTNSGVIRPAGTGATGTLSITGNLTQGATGTIDVELAGSSAGQFDVLAVSGSAALNGTLNVSYLGGYEPGVGINHPVMTYASQVGTFATINDALTQTVNYGATSFTLTGTGATASSMFWDGGAGDFLWTSALNWSTDTLPVSTKDVTIGALGSPVTLSSGAQSINSLLSDASLIVSGGSLTMANPSTINATLTVSGGTVNANGGLNANSVNLSSGALQGLGNIAVSGPFAWTGGTISGTGTNTFTTNGASSLSGGTKTLTSRVWNNAGTATWTGGSIDLSDAGAVVNNQGTFTANLASFFVDFAGVGTFNNLSGAVFNSNAGGFDVSFNGPAATNAGTINVSNGRFNFVQAFTNTGTINLTGAGAVFEAFTGSTANLNAGTSFTGTGEVRVVNGGTLNVNTPLTLPNTQTLSLQGGTLNVNAATTADTLSMTGGTLTGTGSLTVNSSFTQSGGTISGLGALGITQASGNLTFGAPLTVQSLTAQASAGGINVNSSITSSGNVALTANGALSDIDIGASGGITTNAAATATLNAGRDVVLRGAISAASGSLGLTLNPANVVRTPGGATLTLDGGTGGMTATVNNGKTWQNDGTITMQGASTIRLPNVGGYATFSNASGGVLNINSTAGWSFTSDSSVQGGIVNNAGTININNNTSWEAAFTNAATGNLNIAADKFLSMQNGQSLAGTVGIGSGGTLWVSERHGANAAFNGTTVNGTGTLQVIAGVGPVADFTGVNAGAATLLVGSGGTANILSGTSTFGALSMSGGTLTGAGTLALNNAFSQTGGTQTGAGTTILGPSVTYTPGTVTLDRNLTAQGTVNQTSGTLTINSGKTLTVDGTLNLVGGGTAIRGDGNVVVNGALNWSGDSDMSGLGTLTTFGTTTGTDPMFIGRNWVNSGTINVSAGSLEVAATFTNAPNGVINILSTSGRDEVANFGGSFFNQGQFNYNASGAGTVNVLLNNTGTVNVNGPLTASVGVQQSSGTLNIASGQTLTVGGSGLVLAGGRLTTGSTGTVVGNVNNTAGIVAPGASPGILTINGNYVQGPNGVLELEIGGTAPGTYDQLIVTGNSTLGGALNTTFVNNFAPVAGDTLNVIGGTLNGTTFATTSLPAGLTVNYLPSSLSLAGSPPPPPPVDIASPTPSPLPPPADAINTIIAATNVTQQTTQPDQVTQEARQADVTDVKKEDKVAALPMCR